MSDPNSTLISLPERQTLAQRSLYSTLTLLAWLGWIYLWLPLLTAIAWAFGANIAYDRLGLGQDIAALGALRPLLQAAAICAGIFGAWAAYNFVRFAEVERRRGAVTASDALIANHFSASEQISHAMRVARRCVLHLDAAGIPHRTETDLEPAIIQREAAALEHGYDLRPVAPLHPERTINEFDD